MGGKPLKGNPSTATVLCAWQVAEETRGIQSKCCSKKHVPLKPGRAGQICLHFHLPWATVTCHAGRASFPRPCAADTHVARPAQLRDLSANMPCQPCPLSVGRPATPPVQACWPRLGHARGLEPAHAASHLRLEVGSSQNRAWIESSTPGWLKIALPNGLRVSDSPCRLSEKAKR